MNQEHIRQECKFHSRPWIFSFQRGKKCKCPWCMQAMNDAEKAIKISREHEVGKYCKEWTQCNKCSLIKHYTKILRHFSGRECNNRKCPVCMAPKFVQEMWRRDRISIIADLYSLMLGCRVWGSMVQRAIEAHNGVKNE